MKNQSGEKLLGLEVTGSGIYGAVIVRNRRRALLLQASHVFYSPRNDIGEMADALHVLFSQMNLEGCSASAVSFSSDLISFRTLDFPFKSTTKIRQVLPFELTSHLPHAHEKYETDFIVLDHLKKKASPSNPAQALYSQSASEMTPVLTLSIPSEIVDICYTMLDEKGLAPALMTSGGLIAAHAYIKNIQSDRLKRDDRKTKENRCKNPVMPLLEIKDGWATTIILFQNQISAIRSFPLFQPHFQTDVRNYIEPALNCFGLRHGIDAAPDKYKSVPAPNSHLESTMEMVDWETSRPHGKERWVNAVSAAVLCRRGRPPINFCQGRYQKDAFFFKFRKEMTLFSAFMILCLSVFLLNVHRETELLKKELSKLNRSITTLYKQTFPETTVIVEPLMQMKVNVKEAQKATGGNENLSGSSTLPIPAVDILYELSSRIPATIDVKIDRLLLNGDRVVMAGSTDNFNAVDQIKSRLENAAQFSKVTINSAAAEKNGNRVKFNYVIEFE